MGNGNRHKDLGKTLLVTLAVYLAGPSLIAVAHLGLKLDLAIVLAFAFAAAVTGIAMAASETYRSTAVFPITARLPNRASK